MGHAERIIAEIATLDETEKARLLAFVEQLKAAREPTEKTRQDADRRQLAAALAPFRVRLAGYRFDREEASAR